MRRLNFVLTIFFTLTTGFAAVAAAGDLTGFVRDETGGALTGGSVELRADGPVTRFTTTDTRGAYRFDALSSGAVHVSFALPNFATVHHEVIVPPSGELRVDAVLHLSLSADVVVTGKHSFVNLADAENPAENLVGIAVSASQGA